MKSVTKGLLLAAGGCYYRAPPPPSPNGDAKHSSTNG